MDLVTRWSKLFAGMSPASFFNFSFLPKYGVYFLQALGYTLLLAVISVLLAVIPALLLAFMRLSKNKFVRGISGAYIAIFRSTPLLVQLSIIYFGLFGAISIPRLYLFGFIDISRFIPGVVALALNSSAYVAEIFRALQAEAGGGGDAGVHGEVVDVSLGVVSKGLVRVDEARVDDAEEGHISSGGIAGGSAENGERGERLLEHLCISPISSVSGGSMGLN